jgi:predicted permease
MGKFLQDLRYGLRLLTKHPGFAAVAVLSIAIGIGANTTVYTWIETFLLHPLPGVADGDRIAVLENLAPSGTYLTTSYLDYLDYRANAHSLAGLTAFRDQPFILGEGRETQRVWGEMVSGDFFDVLGVRPAAGRFFRPEEGKPGGVPVAVLGNGLWRRRFGSDPGVVGRTVLLNRHPVTVVGVAAADFAGGVVGLAYDVWIPLPLASPWTGGYDRLKNRLDRSLHLLARLRPGTPLSAARAEIHAVAARLARAYPDLDQGIGATLLPVRQASYGAQTLLAPVLAILAGIASLVLLMVCANVANLLLARATARRRELGIRAALGGGRGRLVRQLLTESLLLSLLGGVVGLLASFWMADALFALLPPTQLPIAAMPGPDGRVLAGSLLLSLVAGLLFGIVPALQAAPGAARAASLLEGGRGTSAGRRPRSLRNLLVVAEVALATLVLLGAGLFLQAFERARAIQPGFSSEHILLVGALNAGAAGYDRAALRGFYQHLGERLASLPGATGVSLAERVPLGFDGGSWEEATVDGYVPPPTENMKIFRNLVSPGYFSLLAIPLRAGREFGPKDDEKGAPVIIVNETFAARYLPGVPPLGRHVRVWGKTATIVGVVATGKYASLGEAPLPYLYAPLFQHLDTDTEVVVHLRAAGDPSGLLPAVRRTILGVAPELLAGFTAIPMSQYIGAALFAQRTGATVLGCLGAIALLLAALGLYGVVSYSVTERTHEIGIRMALGARREDVIRGILGQGMRLVALGMFLGTLAALGLSRVLAGALPGAPGASGAPGAPGTPGAPGLPDADWGIFAAVALLLAGVALAANYVPAHRATRVDPVEAIQRG